MNCFKELLCNPILSPPHPIPLPIRGEGIQIPTSVSLAQGGALPLSQRGFTLLELLVVLTIAVLLLTLVPPLFQGAGSTSELKAAARQLAAGLRSARNEAVMRQREVSLMLDLERHRFGVTGAPRQVSLSEDIGIELFTAQSELVNEAAAGIRFFPDGSSTGGRITLTTGERAFAVDVDWLTGKVSILTPDLRE